MQTEIFITLPTSYYNGSDLDDLLCIDETEYNHLHFDGIRASLKNFPSHIDPAQIFATFQIIFQDPIASGFLAGFMYDVCKYTVTKILKLVKERHGKATISSTIIVADDVQEKHSKIKLVVSSENVESALEKLAPILASLDSQCLFDRRIVYNDETGKWDIIAKN